MIWTKYIFRQRLLVFFLLFFIHVLERQCCTPPFSPLLSSSLAFLALQNVLDRRCLDRYVRVSVQRATTITLTLSTITNDISDQPSGIMFLQIRSASYLCWEWLAGSSSFLDGHYPKAEPHDIYTGRLLKYTQIYFRWSTQEAYINREEALLWRII